MRETNWVSLKATVEIWLENQRSQKISAVLRALKLCSAYFRGPEKPHFCHPSERASSASVSLKIKADSSGRIFPRITNCIGKGAYFSFDELPFFLALGAKRQV